MRLKCVTHERDCLIEERNRLKQETSELRQLLTDANNEETTIFVCSFLTFVVGPSSQFMGLVWVGDRGTCPPQCFWGWGTKGTLSPPCFTQARFVYLVPR